MNEALFQEILGLNLLAGLVTPTRALARRWIEAGTRGCVINLASMTSYKGLSGTWAYNAAKAGVLNLNGCLAKELAPQGIRVNANAPGFFLGHQNRALLVDERTEELTDRGKAIVGRTSFGRLGDMAELHGAALFLARDKAAGFVIGRSEICRSAPSEPHTGSAGSSTPTSPVTASGRSLSFVEARMAELLPLYEYVHSPRSASGLTMSLAPEEARRAVARGVIAGPDDVVVFVGSGATAAVNKARGGLGPARARAARAGVSPVARHTGGSPTGGVGRSVRASFQ